MISKVKYELLNAVIPGLVGAAIMFFALDINFSVSSDKKTILIDLSDQFTSTAPMDHRDKVRSFASDLSDAYGLSSDKAQRYSRWIIDAQDIYGVDKYVMASVIMTESTFRENVVSHAGAVGPAQVKPFYWSEECPGDIINNPKDNIFCGAYILSDFKASCDDNIDCALKTYNVGFGNYSSPSYQGAKARYITKIERHMDLISSH